MIDQCPDEDEDEDGFEDEDGCPDPDNDQDGILDVDDQCPMEAEDRDGYEDEDGCPDPDNDGDGVADGDDQCPTEAEDIDQFEDQDGCPDPDNDHDGVLDAADQCADGAETINGVDDTDGCPDEGGRSLWRMRGERDAADMTLTGTIRFGRDNAIAPGSTNAVEQLALHLIALASPMRVSIASDEAARREALTAALTERGVAAERFEVVTDGELTGNRVVVTRAPTAEEGAQQSTADGSAGRGASNAPAGGTPAQPSE